MLMATQLLIPLKSVPALVTHWIPVRFTPVATKGYGMLMFIDFISGALVGADMGMDHITKKDSTKGHIMFAIDS